MKTLFLALVARFVSMKLSSLQSGERDIFEAARSNDVARVKQLNAVHDKPAADSFTLLILAAYNGSTKAVGVYSPTIMQTSTRAAGW